MQHLSLWARFYRRFHKGIVFITIVVITIIFLFTLNYIFRVKTISIIGDKEIQLLGLDVLRSKNLILLQSEKEAEIIRQQNPAIKHVTIQKIFPSTIKLLIAQYDPYAVLEGNSKFMIISQDGRILKKQNDLMYSIPRIHYYQKLNENLFRVGDTVNYKDMIIALKIITFLKDLGLNIDTVDITGFDVLVCKVQEKEYIFSIEKSVDRSRYEVEQIIKKYRIEGKNYRKIDVRFDKPVITF